MRLNYKIIKLIIFSLMVILAFSYNVNADSNKCTYTHPTYSDCKLTLTQNGGRTNDWKVTSYASNGKLKKACAKVNKQNVWYLLPNSYHNKKFLSEFGKKFEENDSCPSIYLGKGIYNCSDKFREFSTTESAAVGKLKAKCFFVYTKKEGMDRTKITVKKEEKAQKFATCYYNNSGCVFQMQKTSADAWSWVKAETNPAQCTFKDAGQKKLNDIKPNPSTNFGTNFDKLVKGNMCPNLYVGCTVYNTVRGGTKAGLRNTYRYVYLQDKACKDGGKRILLKGEEIQYKTEDKASADTNDDVTTQDGTRAHRIDPEKMQKLVDNGEISQIKIGDKTFNCRQLIGDELYKHIKVIFTLIRIAAPILLIIFGMLDFTKAVTQGADTLTKSTKTFTKRLIICVIIFLVPTIIDFIMNVTGISDGICGL